MNFLLDTDTCAAHLRRPAKLAHRFIQHAGRLAVPTFGLAELYAGAYNHPNPSKLLPLIADLLQEVHVQYFDAACAEQFGQVRATLLKRTRSANHVLDGLSKLVARPCRWEEAPCRLYREPAADPTPPHVSAGNSASTASDAAA